MTTYMYHSNALSRQPEAKIKFIKQNKAKFTEKHLPFLCCGAKMLEDKPIRNTVVKEIQGPIKSQ